VAVRLLESDHDELGPPLARRACECRRDAPCNRFQREERRQAGRLVQPLAHPLEVHAATPFLQRLAIEVGKERGGERQWAHHAKDVRVHPVPPREQLRDVKRSARMVGVLTGDEERTRVSALGQCDVGGSRRLHELCVRYCVCHRSPPWVGA
jgi:hypothetical protein